MSNGTKNNPSVKTMTGAGKVVGTRVDNTPGIIFFPSCTTPCIVGEDSMLGMLVLGTESNPITPQKVNMHLKMIAWTNAAILANIEVNIVI